MDKPLNNRISAVFPGEVKTTGMTFDKSLPYQDWAPCGVQLRRFSDWNHFSFGDWLNFGESAYGELYAQAADETGYTPGYLQQLQRVSRSVPIDIRRLDKLSYGHHILVAPARYPLAAKKHWLDGAIDQSWTVREMRTAMATLPVRVTPRAMTIPKAKGKIRETLP